MHFRSLLTVSLFVSFVFHREELKGYTEVPALVHIGIDQEDSFGFNLVHDLPGVLYASILKGEIKLWDSPNKNTQILPASLIIIEKGNNVSFERMNSIFVNELWSSSRRKTSFVILGISFMAEGNKGKISLGYVDAFEAIRILHNSHVRSNVNGPAKLSLIDALYSRRYFYSLVQFGRNTFHKDPMENQKVIHKAFNSGKRVEHLHIVPEVKSIVYEVIPGNQKEGDPGKALFDNFETFLNNNREVFFEKGGNRYFDFITYKSELAVTRIEIHEYWQKVRGKIFFTPVSVKLYVNNKELDPFSMDEVKKFNLRFNFKMIDDVLQEKSFEYQLTRLNNTFIAPVESEDYKRALNNYYWTQISYYIKYFKP